ncbi:MAG: hypothetical protein AAFY88_08475 [Acidobacteriota bacterium]
MTREQAEAEPPFYLIAEEAAASPAATKKWLRRNFGILFESEFVLIYSPKTIVDPGAA